MYAAASSASLAVDGYTSGSSPWVYPCTQTKPQANPWWFVDLGASMAVSSVRLFNRLDCCWDRLRSFTIRVGDVLPTASPYTSYYSSNEAPYLKSNPVCYTQSEPMNHTAGVQDVLAAACPGMKGRYVSVEIAAPSAVLSLCEVQVGGP